VLSGILFDGLRRLHFHEENAKVNADNFTKYLLPKLADACRLAFQQDMAQRSWNDSDSGSTRQPRLRFTIIINYYYYYYYYYGTSMSYVA